MGGISNDAILGLLGMYFDAAVVFVTFTQISSGHTVFHIVFSEQRHLIRFHLSMNIHPIVSVE